MKRILFVDDEPRLLEALQRMLRPQRKRWEMAFANSGESALSLMEAQEFDVVVTDMRMPGMDGAQLLELTQKRFPAAIRMVLSGHVELEAAIRAAPVAHQFLTKPCDPAKLVDAIDRACGCTAMVSDETVRGIIGAIGSLPSLPGNCAALLAALDDTEMPLEHVGRIVQQDVGMSAKILQLVNSAFFSLRGEVGSIPEAVRHLGFDLVKQLVLSAQVFQSFRLTRPIERFSIEELHAHSRATAFIAARLPVRTDTEVPAAVPAFLHDVGKLVLASRLPRQFEEMLKIANERGCALHVVEEESIRVGHAEIGAYLLELWTLPKPIVSAVYHHHAPITRTPGPELDLTAATHLADFLASEAIGAKDPADRAAADDYLTNLGFADQIPAWRALAEEAIATVSRVH